MMRTKLMLWGAAAAVAVSSTAAVASVVIVRSIGPSSKAYPPGKTLPESANITLQGGDVVTVLGPNAAQTLRGPGKFAAGQVTLVSAAGKRGRFGALRTGEIAKNPSIWDVDVTQSGRICVSQPASLQLWRPDAGGEAKINIRSDDGTTQQVKWAAGKSIVAWPTALPMKNSVRYQFEWADGGEKNTVTFVTVPRSPPDLVATAQLLIENGCENQLDLLVENASKSSD
jgi:hypothetical protein